MRSFFVNQYVNLRRRLIGSGIGQFYLVKLLNDLILKCLKRNYAIVQGHKMYLDKGDSLELSLNGIYEPKETELVRKLIKPGDVVIDIGAHIGYYTLIFAELVGQKGRVFIFEPDPNNFALLKKNVEVNGFNNVILVNAAVTGRTGSFRLTKGKNPSSNPTISGKGTGIEVGGISLDDYFQYYDKEIDLIKMDIEGGEPDAIFGMTNLLIRNEDVKIITEVYSEALKEYGYTKIGYLNLLGYFGFKCEPIDDMNYFCMR